MADLRLITFCNRFGVTMLYYILGFSSSGTSTHLNPSGASGLRVSRQSGFSGSFLNTSIAARIVPIAATRHIPQKVIAFSSINSSSHVSLRTDCPPPVENSEAQVMVTPAKDGQGVGIQRRTPKHVLLRV